MRRRAILGLGLSCLLTACTHGGYGAVDLGWSLHHADGEGAKLAYGQADSDNVLLMMTCQPKSGQVLVSMTAPDSVGLEAIEIASRGHSSRLPGASAPAMTEGSSLIEAMAPASDPALQSFARTGDIAVVENGRAAHMPVRKAERARVADFFAQCQAA
ncbi:MAG: hypothetical protein V4820_01290 [Pseudomonadota bacterium]